MHTLGLHQSCLLAATTAVSPMLSSVLSCDGLLLDHSGILIPRMPLIRQATLAGGRLLPPSGRCSVLSSSLRVLSRLHPQPPHLLPLTPKIMFKTLPWLFCLLTPSSFLPCPHRIVGVPFIPVFCSLSGSLSPKVYLEFISSTLGPTAAQVTALYLVAAPAC